LASPSGTVWLPESPLEIEQAQQQLHKLLESHEFRNSQRYPAFLRYVVEQTLAGGADHLKERTLGIAVFHRPVDYDTNADPVVRVTAGEVRKRLALYYQEHPGELRIELPAGSYIPHLYPAASPHAAPEPGAAADPGAPAPAVLQAHLDPSAPRSADAIPAPELPTPEPVPHEAKRTTRRMFGITLLAAVALLCGVGGFFYYGRSSAGLTSLFWAPLAATPSGPLFVLGEHPVPIADMGSMSQEFSAPLLEEGGNPAPTLPPLSMMPMGDVLSVARVTSVLGGEGVSFDLQSSAHTSLGDLRGRPAVLFGAFDNPWTRQAAGHLRFRFQRMYRPDGSQVVAIVDTGAPGRSWSIVWSQPLFVKHKDYALVARFFDAESQQQTVIIAGLGENGTVAAGQFVTENRYLKQLNAFAPPGGWAHKDLEAVIETPVVEGLSGPPQVVAATFW
jgi:hypothetical protein